MSVHEPAIGFVYQTRQMMQRSRVPLDMPCELFLEQKPISDLWSHHLPSAATTLLPLLLHYYILWHHVDHWD
jgi:hypothetical protein